MELLQSSIPVSSSVILSCCHTSVDRNKLGILIALPFGVPTSIAHAAFEKFEHGFNVVTWESRFILNLD